MCHPSIQDKQTSYLKSKSEYDFFKKCRLGRFIKAVAYTTVSI